MLYIDEKTQQINITRGDIAQFDFTTLNEDGELYMFKIGDVLRFKIFKKNLCSAVVLQKDFTIEEDSTVAEIILNAEDTKIGNIINKYVDYWYEIELNPDTAPQTLVGYEVSEKGEIKEKIFRLLPEGADI